jgi:hypothetical protein
MQKKTSPDMKKLHYSIKIDAPREKVWHAMLDDETYRDWTSAFSPGSYYKGTWQQGSKILFLAPQQGKGDSGMVTMVAENRPYEFISLHHIGIIEDGVEKTDPSITQEWGDALENYTLRSYEEGTEVLIDVDTPEEYVAMMDEMWPRALNRLKEIAEE